MTDVITPGKTDKVTTKHSEIDNMCQDIFLDIRIKRAPLYKCVCICLGMYFFFPSRNTIRKGEGGGEREEGKGGERKKSDITCIDVEKERVSGRIITAGQLLTIINK